MDQFQWKSCALVGIDSKCHLESTVETIADHRSFCKSPILGCTFLGRSFGNLDQHMRSSISTGTETSLTDRITQSILMARDTFLPESKKDIRFENGLSEFRVFYAILTNSEGYISRRLSGCLMEFLMQR